MLLLFNAVQYFARLVQHFLPVKFSLSTTSQPYIKVTLSLTLILPPSPVGFPFILRNSESCDPDILQHLGTFH